MDYMAGSDPGAGVALVAFVSAGLVFLCALAAEVAARWKGKR